MNDYEEQYIDRIASSKRLDVVWASWMGDWFVSHSPRNGNSNAEGTWDQWVQLAISILQHPATDVVRPEAREAVAQLVNTKFYSESNRLLADDEMQELFGSKDD